MMETAQILLFRFWWVILFSLACFAALEQGSKKIKATYALLDEKFTQLENEKRQALIIQENLQLQIASQTDPAWVELLLIKGLGVVPEGQIKVFFE